MGRPKMLKDLVKHGIVVEAEKAGEQSLSVTSVGSSIFYESRAPVKIKGHKCGGCGQPWWLMPNPSGVVPQPNAHNMMSHCVKQAWLAFTKNYLKLWNVCILPNLHLLCVNASIQ